MANYSRPLDRLQGAAARIAGLLLPEAAHDQLARWLKLPHHHPDLDPSLRTILAVRELRGGKRAVAHDPVQSRLRFRQEMASIRGRATLVGQVEDLKFETENGQLKARLYRPIEATQVDRRLPLLVFFHGGGFMVGDLDTHDEPCRMLCRFGRMNVLSIDYRLAPEHPFPAAFEDAIAAVQWAHTQAERWQVDQSRIAVGGDSAGGNLAATVSVALANQPERPAAQLLIYAGIEFYMQTESKKHYCDGLFLTCDAIEEAYRRYNPDEQHSPTDPRMSPIHAPSHADLPPALIVTAALDALRDEAEIYGQTLRIAGTTCMMRRIAGQSHGFINMTPINRGAYYATQQLAADFRLLLDGVVL
ncbi:MAG: alpha/beta hydrolase [Pseudomonadota bacterium]|nr:alpha/beta hydrolase [Pseudomonadota bacterium]